MPQPFDAVVFDLDGTLIDTESLCNAAGAEACAPGSAFPSRSRSSRARGHRRPHPARS
jgi:beta-phosphoglucomutase-like phosphatase (HAD superfamily)